MIAVSALIEGVVDRDWDTQRLRVGGLDLPDHLLHLFPSPATVTIWLWSRTIGPGLLTVRQGEVDDDEWDPVNRSPVITVGEVDAAAEVARYHDSWLRVEVSGRLLDQRTDPEHPRYDPLVDVILSAWSALVPGRQPGDHVRVPLSVARRLDDSGRLARACPPDCDLLHVHNTTEGRPWKR